jgi:hypothetical protein
MNDARRRFFVAEPSGEVAGPCRAMKPAAGQAPAAAGASNNKGGGGFAGGQAGAEKSGV